MSTLVSLIFLFSTTALPIYLTTCPEVIISNTSGYEWNEHDDKMLDYSEKRCYSIYKNSPCLKTFEKYDERDYRAICGRQE